MTTQAAIFVGYFVVVFAIGWVALRATRTEADYWIAGGDLGWFTGGATLAATHTSAGTFVGTIGVMYTAGWSFGWVLLSIPLAYWFMAAVLAPRFTRQRELTLPAFMETRYYGKGIRGLAAVIVLVATVIYVQAQIVAGGLIANLVFGIPLQTGMVIFTAVLLVYTVAGGMMAVVYTDAFQLVVMALGAILAVPLALRQLDGAGGLLSLVESAHPLVFSWEAMPASLLLTMGLSFFLGGIATPEKVIRLYAMKDMATIRRGVLFAIVMILAMNLLVFVLALAAIVLFPQLPTGDLAMPMVATAVLPATLGAIMLAAVTAAMMSTVDSLLILASSAVVRDLAQQIFRPDLDDRTLARLGRLTTVVLGLAALGPALAETRVIFWFVLFAWSGLACAFTPVVLCGLFWKRTTRAGALAGMLTGFVVTVSWVIFFKSDFYELYEMIPGFVAGLAVTVGVSLAGDPPAGAADDFDRVWARVGPALRDP